MNAGIIAAGDGSRLRSEGLSMLKPLVPVNGTPLIERLLTTFFRCGVTNVSCIVNEFSTDVKRYVEERFSDRSIHFIVKTTPSSMHSLFALSPYLRGDGQFLLTTVDSVFDEDEFTAYLHHARTRTSADGVLAITSFVDDETPLFVQLDSADRIVGFSKTDQSPWVTGGLYVLSPRIFDEMETALTRGINRLRNFLSHLISSGYRLEAFRFSKIVDVDHVADIAVAEEFLRGKR